MAWVAEENFNSYSDGDLASNNGGSGWSDAWANNATNQVTVQGTTVYEGAKAAKTNNSSGLTDYRRTLSSAVSGNGNIVYVVMSRSGISNSGDHALIFKNSSGLSRCAVKLDASQNIVIAGSTSVTILSNFSFDTKYVIRLTLNVGSNTVTGAYSTTAFGGSGSFSTESSAATMSNSGDIDRISINDDLETGTNMLDYISATSPFSVVQNLTLAIDTASYTLTTNSVGLGRIYTIMIDAAQYIFNSFSVLLKKMGWEAIAKNNVTMSVTSKNNSTWTPQDKS